jgi:hypothetical protein
MEKSQNQTKTMYKRPTLRLHKPTLQFVTHVRANGSTASAWVAAPLSSRPIPNGTPGRVGEIVDAMRRGADCIQRPAPTLWTPPSDYKYAASYMPAETREQFIARCEAWFEANPPRAAVEPVAKPVVDSTIIQNLFRKHSGCVPPLDERLRAYKAAGYPDAYLIKVMDRHAKMEETSDERQKALDAIFAKWPSASKPVPKPKGKVIKAVKKRT